MKQCIICKQYKEKTEFNKEHVIPESIGGSLTIENVCKTCNNKLGKIDETLINNLFIRILLDLKGVVNKKGKKIPVIPELTRNNPRTKCKLKQEKGKWKFETITEVTAKKDGFEITCGSDKTEEEILTDVRRIFKKKFKRNLTKEEETQIISPNKHRIENPSFPVSYNVNFSKLNKIEIKIAYEIACYLLGEKYLKDPIGCKLLKFLLDETQKCNEIDDNLIGNTGFKNFKPFEKVTKKHLIHFILISADKNNKNKIYISIVLFNEYTYNILITENAEEYDLNSYVFIAFFYEEATGKKWFEEYNDRNIVELFDL